MIAVALAGGAGAAARFLLDGLIRSLAGTRLPWGTLTINALGSLALGWLIGTGPNAAVAIVVGSGFLGGFTTFSAASFETARLALDRRWTAAVGYGLGSLCLCVTAAALGYFLAASIAA